MKYSKNAWDQLKGVTSDDLISALLKDGYVLDGRLKTERVYRHPSGKKVSIHFHTGSRDYGPRLLKSLLEDIGWSEKEMRRLKLIK